MQGQNDRMIRNGSEDLRRVEWKKFQVTFRPWWVISRSVLILYRIYTVLKSLEVLVRQGSGG